MQINATQIRVGQILDLDGDLYRVSWTMHRTPGKGNACMQTKLKHIITGKNLEQRFLSNDRVERATLETREMQYLYPEAEGKVFMDNQTFDQSTLPQNLLEGIEQYLTEGESYPISFYDGQAVGVELPKSIVLGVTMAPPEIKKATATSTMRPIELENGMTILAPGFIKEGDKVKINTETSEYIERA